MRLLQKQWPRLYAEGVTKKSKEHPEGKTEYASFCRAYCCPQNFPGRASTTAAYGHLIPQSFFAKIAKLYLLETQHRMDFLSNPSA